MTVMQRAIPGTGYVTSEFRRGKVEAACEPSSEVT
jgi:hypothetical protein